ncbi:hypothetical protein FRB91_008262 [Serendipita sp. 411]|nr:hypothetical protein FRB91_008262 [Serendipita sp. 411]
MLRLVPPGLSWPLSLRRPNILRPDAAPPLFDQSALNYESLEDCCDPSSSSCSAMSLYSFNSERDTATFVHNANGRKFNKLNPLYKLPSDQPEFSRHDKQHELLKSALGGHLYPAPELVESVLSNIPNRRKAILDLGSGSGAWCIEMANKFEHADVVGVDLVANASRPTPSNCRFEFDDINLGLSHYYNQFDLVHSRAVVNGIDDFTRYVEDIVGCLRPGGVAILVEGDWRPYREDKITPYPLAGLGGNEGSWWGRICFEAFELMKKRGSSIDGGDEVEKGLHHPLLRDNQTASYFVPLGPWAIGDTEDYTADLKKQGQLMAENAKEFTGALSHLFEDAGLQSEVVSSWLDNVNADLENDKIHQYVKYRYAWGIKKTSEVAE